MARRVIVVGSGAAGLVAAVVAAKHGLSPLVLEKANLWGGTTAMSGGALWIPAHPLMAANGVHDDIQSAERYLDALISAPGVASSAERRKVYLRTGPEMVQFLRREGFEWAFSPFPDYYPDAQFASYGRGIGPALVDGSALGPWRASMRSMVRIPALVIRNHEFMPLLMATKNWRNAAIAAKVFLRTAFWRLRGKAPMFIGQALTAQLMVIAQRLNVEVRLSTPVTGLLMESGHVVGVRSRNKSGIDEIRADAGVILCAGGFARNAALRQQFQGIGADYSVTVPEDTGDALQAALGLGAATESMDDSWWGVSAIFPDGSRSFLMWERTLPHSLIVDQSGCRFANEAGPYNDLGRALLERNRTVPACPSWLIMDARHRRNYAFANLMGRYTPRDLIDRGFFVRANSVADLARACQIDGPALMHTIQRFNAFASSGKDTDFHRGDSLFDRVYGDAAFRPNPTLGTLERAPFWAVRVYPSDLGTKGGLVTDSDGRVLDRLGQPISGLYASGNTTASVMGRAYPGPGATLGPAAVFAYRAARHAASEVMSALPVRSP